MKHGPWHAIPISNLPGWYCKRHLDPPDAIETAARLHFEGLNKKVFAPCLGHLQSTSDPDAPHGKVLTELFALADCHEEEKSVVFGLVYAMLSINWDRKSTPGYYDYLNLMRVLDNSDIVVRALTSISGRISDVQSAVRERLLLLFGDMVYANWPKAESILLALQRAAAPGNLWPGAAELIGSLLSCLVANTSWILTKDMAFRKTVLWLLRWTAFMELTTGSADVKTHDLRDKLDEATTKLLASKEMLRAQGEALGWALLASRVPTWESFRCGLGREDLCQAAEAQR
ncbi:unnamed protein product [Durusdinium trenchii]|uniref:Integrator complex subunit 3 N-terminal domain-containing protein n=1 Tax=Durusdinium trenchii TaxID=1381693 RepID=A0ABP0QMT2_9DINO